MNDLTMTIAGWAATSPTVRLSTQGVELCSFRLASTPRYFDRNAGVWTDGRTEWFTVRCFRSAAVTVAESVHKGEPVIVTGKLRTHEWTTSDGVDRVDLQIDATGVGHDLTRGVARFSKAEVASRSQTDESETNSSGIDGDGPDGDDTEDEAADAVVTDAPVAGEHEGVDEDESSSAASAA